MTSERADLKQEAIRRIKRWKGEYDLLIFRMGGKLIVTLNKGDIRMPRMEDDIHIGKCEGLIEFFDIVEKDLK